jgi:hypothetical protein
MTSLISRIKKLEGRAGSRAGRSWRPETDADWLAVFEAHGRGGEFDGEPDFPVALEAYRRAVESSGPGERFLKEWEWLAEMADRVAEGKTPVTGTEFNDLAGWFRRNEAKLDGLIDVGGGRRVDRTNLTYALAVSVHGTKCRCRSLRLFFDLN